MALKRLIIITELNHGQYVCDLHCKDILRVQMEVGLVAAIQLQNDSQKGVKL